jgi:ABC-type transport system involved in multi-copper enzyme maturation permease subunit
MKTFWIVFLVILIYIVGLCGYYFWANTESSWRYLAMFFGWMLIGFPACIWWEKYFKDLFNSK